MKKIFSIFVAAMMALTSFAVTKHIYINNQTGWEAVALYGWYDGRADVLGAWPGIQAAGTVQHEGADYLDFQVEDTAFPFNAIFNNNGGGTQLADYLLQTADDYYLVAYSSGLSPAGSPEPTFVTYHVYVNNTTGWDAFYLYAWGDKDYFGGWPGTQSTAVNTVTKDNVAYLDFAFQVVEGTTAISANLIFHNNVGEGQAGDQRQLISLTEPRDYYLNVPATGDITEAGRTIVTYHLYVHNSTDWQNFYIYAWGDKDYFGAWPGTQSTAVNTVSHEGVDYLDFPYDIYSDVTDMNMNLIFHNNIGEGQDGDKRILISKTEPKNEYITVAEELTGIDEVESQKSNVESRKMIMNGQLFIIRDGRTFNALGAEIK